jgi:hypothetical protein
MRTEVKLYIDLLVYCEMLLSNLNVNHGYYERVQDKILEAARMNFMRSKCEMTRRDKIRREDIGRQLRVVNNV